MLYYFSLKRSLSLQLSIIFYLNIIKLITIKLLKNI